MNTYGFSKQGSSHKTNQDYFLLNPDYAIISDGCSAFPHTDYGARILSHILDLNIEQYDLNLPLDRKNIFSNTVYKATSSGIIKDINNLHATLGLVKKIDNRNLMLLQGDGSVFYKKNDEFVIHSVDSTQTVNGQIYSMPYYPLYDITGGEGYLDVAPFKQITTTVFIKSDDGTYQINSHKTQFSSEELLVISEHDCDFYGVTTDGFETFVDESSKQLLNLERMVFDLFININPVGEFVKRAYTHQMKANPLLHHYDDFTVVYIIN